MGGYQPTSFYDPGAARIPVWKLLLPVLMLLVAAMAAYLAYRDAFPEGFRYSILSVVKELSQVELF